MDNIVESKRNIYTPSKFAKESLIYLQEVGISKTIKKHTNSRNYMDSFLFFIVLEGNGILKYDNQEIYLNKDSCVFIDCHKSYSHTSDNWKIAWVHFNSNTLLNIYNKFIERENRNYIYTDIKKYSNIIEDILLISSSNDYTKDMNIYSKLTELLNLLMSETIYQDINNKKYKYNINDIKKYIDDNYTSQISLDDLSNKFFINKFYLTRTFKDNFDTTINNYILQKRITKSKELLRFSNKKIEELASICGFKDPNYFSRIFKRIEGITPNEYKKIW